MDKYIDLHIHSIFSDGKFSIEELLNLARANNVSTISITDHDNIDSVKEIKGLGLADVDFLSGVELSSMTNINGRLQWLHILGYDFDEDNDELNSKLEEKRNIRIDVNTRYLMELLYEFDFLDENIMEQIVCEKYISISRLILQYMIDNDYTVEQLSYVRNYLKGHKPFYPNYEFSEEEAISLIVNAGGHPILAHPYQYNLSLDEEIDLLKKLKSFGLTGIEKYHSGDTHEGMQRQGFICDKFGFEWTVGSDFHTDKDDFGNEIGLGKNRNLCKDSCSLVKKIR